MEGMEKEINVLKNDVNWRKSNEKKTQECICKLAKDKNSLTIKLQEIEKTVESLKAVNSLKA